MTDPLEALNGVVNAAQPLPLLLTSGQPGPTHFKALRSAGVEVVIDIRDPMEPRPLDEPALVRELGMEYRNLSVRQGALDDAMLEGVLAALRDSEGRLTLLHCASANRVGGVLIPYLMLDHGMSEEQAVDAAMAIGLRGVDLLEWGVEYARRKTGG